MHLEELGYVHSVCFPNWHPLHGEVVEGMESEGTPLRFCDAAFRAFFEVCLSCSCHS